MQGEMQEEVLNVNAALNDVDQLEGSACGYCDVEMVARGIDATDENTQALLAVVGEMAVVGTDVVPVTEDFSESVRTIYETIKALLHKAWEHIKGFYNKFFGYKQTMRDRIKQLREELTRHREVPSEDKPMIHVPISDGYIFCIDGKKLIDTQSFQTIMRDIFTNVQHNFKIGPLAVEKLGQAFAATMRDFDPRDPAETVHKSLQAHVVPALWMYFDSVRIKGFKPNTIVDGTEDLATAESDMLAGNCFVKLVWGAHMHHYFITRKTDISMADILHDMQIMKVELKQKEQPAEKRIVTMPAFKHAGMKLALDEIEKGLDMIDAFERNGTEGKLKMNDDFARAAQSTGAKVRDEADRLYKGRGGPVAKALEQTYTQLTKLSALHTRLAVHPLMEISKRTLGTFNAILNMVEKSMTVYVMKSADEMSNGVEVSKDATKPAVNKEPQATTA